MKVSDYLVKYLIDKGITDVYGYPGGMVTHLMDSFRKFAPHIAAHVMYHEQAAAFAACGYAQASGKVGVAYATSGPGATNLITGICNAYFDSIPTLFLTGQVNTFELKESSPVRQKGFQETDIVSMIRGVTKYAACIKKPERIKWYLDRAFAEAQGDRKGPVLLDIPMDIMRAEIETESLESFDGCLLSAAAQNLDDNELQKIEELLARSCRPLLLLGCGLKFANITADIIDLLNAIDIPIVTTMNAFDVVPHSRSYGFIGAYGGRTANFIAAKCDLLISIGARLDVRQVGAMRKNFAPKAKILRVDIDEGELSYLVRDDEIHLQKDAICVLEAIRDIMAHNDTNYGCWQSVCAQIKQELTGIDEDAPTRFVNRLSQNIPENTLITTDVGQNQVWVAQAFEVRRGQRIFFSGGHGAMGYSLPAAIGACKASGNVVICFCGDGGFQMNIQELQTVVREKLPIKIILLNNNALGMIRHFQEMYFDKDYFQTTASCGYTVPNFGKIAGAYGILYRKVEKLEDIDSIMLQGRECCLIEVRLPEKTYVSPKLQYGKPNQDQEPCLDRSLYNKIMQM